jgi:hypothetical protein
VFIRTKDNFSFWRALKEYYDYSLISTCKESSRYFIETMVTVKLEIHTMQERDTQ